ncbi:hypothetical protein VUR80DRAFT_9299 [Thermomyces stellatus]
MIIPVQGGLLAWRWYRRSETPQTKTGNLRRGLCLKHKQRVGPGRGTAPVVFVHVLSQTPFTYYGRSRNFPAPISPVGAFSQPRSAKVVDFNHRLQKAAVGLLYRYSGHKNPQSPFDCRVSKLTASGRYKSSRGQRPFLSARKGGFGWSQRKSDPVTFR